MDPADMRHYNTAAKYTWPRHEQFVDSTSGCFGGLLYNETAARGKEWEYLNEALGSKRLMSIALNTKCLLTESLVGTK